MLTGRQQEIWNFLTQYVDEHGYPPTVREIGEAVGLASPRPCTRTSRTWSASG
jgi:repressor LexA